MSKSCVILAAGDGKRMNSSKPKVLMEVAYEPMLAWVIDAVQSAGIADIAVIIGNQAEQVEAFLKNNDKYAGCKTFLQAERKGTGHAVMQAESFLREHGGDVLVLCGDAPFIDSDTLNKAYELHKSENRTNTTVSADVAAPQGYGRIVRDIFNSSKLSRIVEEKDCSEAERSITEVNSGVYWFDTAALLETLPKLTTENANGEYYLTDVVELLEESAGVYKTENACSVIGANDRKGLQAVNDIAWELHKSALQDGGVDFIGESYIGRNVTVGKDTVILPNSIIRGKVTIGEGCTIGPNSLIENCTVGNGTVLNNVQAFSSEIGNNVRVGPFVHLRPNTTLKDSVKIGDFVETKNAVIGEKTSIAHLSYIGDSDVGKGVNFGCGCVTANYDGVKKYRTVVGDNAFIGCNTNLIAPVTIGENAMTAAGSTISKDVPPNSLAIERASVVVKEDWKGNALRKKV